MDALIIRKISQEVYRRFPEFSGCEPRVSSQSASAGKPANYLLTYSTRVQTAASATLARSVRVVAAPDGKILKISTSH
jgi:hypothetical protein